MAKIQIGKVVPTYAGEWRSNTEYLSQTVVVYGGSSFISIRDLVGSLKGVAPINDGVNWRLVRRDMGERHLEGRHMEKRGVAWGDMGRRRMVEGI